MGIRFLYLKVCIQCNFQCRRKVQKHSHTYLGVLTNRMHYHWLLLQNRLTFGFQCVLLSWPNAFIQTSPWTYNKWGPCQTQIFIQGFLKKLIHRLGNRFLCSKSFSKLFGNYLCLTLKLNGTNFEVSQDISILLFINKYKEKIVILQAIGII